MPHGQVAPPSPSRSPSEAIQCELFWCGRESYCTGLPRFKKTPRNFGMPPGVVILPPGTFVLVLLRYHRHAGALNDETWDRDKQNGAVEGKNIDGCRPAQRVIVNL